ncbi:IclR family transcriptional regulator [Amorphus coralli]|uniref:IclR family transcriptional regulator n=1 Tax=Amorphus coralli TaxID=340680 RepID=UPI0003756FCA|nr:IclR family transcriptional regulator [Amorphus coralli]
MQVLDEGKETIPTNLRLLLVMEAVAAAGVPVTPTQINQAIGLPKPTIHRLFATLEEEGFLQRDIDGRSYAPGRRAREMAGGILSSLRLRTARLAILTRLAAGIGETCNISLPERDEMIYLERVETAWPLRIQLPVGTRVPFYCTSSGKMYLSSLPNRHLDRYLAAARLEPRTPNSITDPDRLRAALLQIRADGFATDDEEFMEGMIALAVPVRDTNGRLFATLSFHAPTQRFDIARAKDHLPQLRAAAEELSRLSFA